jgi:DNA-binding transcriptional MerR regulator
MAEVGMTIDDLARRTQLPVRTIREYHTMRLLPPPERRGRVGIYGPTHSQRLELISRLQRRGYSLAGIRDLLQAWEDGAGLTSLLGVEPAATALDETPLRLTQAELAERLPPGDWLGQAAAAGIVLPDGDTFLVRSPALLALVSDGAAAGIPLDAMLRLAGTLRRELASLAAMIAELIIDRMVPALPAGRDPDVLQPLLQRGRQLLLQGTVSILADQLGAALAQRSAETEGSAALRDALERIRVGAVADSSGSITRGAAR